MATLNSKHKRFIVERLACWDTPTEVQEAFREEFGIEVSRQQMWNYDASKEYSRGKMAKSLVALFDETREAFRSSTEGIPIAQKSYRLRRLDRVARLASQMKNHVLEMEALERAAKEVGEAYTNRRHVDHTSGGEQITGVVFSPPGAADDE